MIQFAKFQRFFSGCLMKPDKKPLIPSGKKM
jgi:hypothetical protein